jgi:hypothetical protein
LAHLLARFFSGVCRTDLERLRWMRHFISRTKVFTFTDPVV